MDFNFKINFVFLKIMFLNLKLKRKQLYFKIFIFFIFKMESTLDNSSLSEWISMSSKWIENPMDCYPHLSRLHAFLQQLTNVKIF